MCLFLFSLFSCLEVALETLEGHQRAIMGSMTVEEIYRDRKKFSKAVFEVASSDLVNMGITVVSYTLKDIRDEEGYLKALGLARTAEVKRDARIGEAEARRDAQIKEAIAEEERMASRLLNDTEIAKAKRDFELKKAAYDVEVQTKVISLLLIRSFSNNDTFFRKLRLSWLMSSRLPRPSRGSRRRTCRSR